MAEDYLSELPVTPSQRAWLAGLGASSAAALLSMIRAAPADFDRMLGVDQACGVVRALEGRLSDHERAVLTAGPQRKFATGALLGYPHPEPSEARFDIQQRDLLFRQLEELRRRPPSEETRRRIQALESELNAMLEGV